MADSQEPGKLTRKSEKGNSCTIDDLAGSQEPGKLTSKAEEGNASNIYDMADSQIRSRIWPIARSGAGQAYPQGRGGPDGTADELRNGACGWPGGTANDQAGDRGT